MSYEYDTHSHYWESLKSLQREGAISVYDVHSLYGQFCGYKPCCVKNFVNLVRLGIPAAAFMAWVLGHDHPGVHHVLCPMCYAEYDKQHKHRKRRKTILCTSEEAELRNKMEFFQKHFSMSYVWEVMNNEKTSETV